MRFTKKIIVIVNAYSTSKYMPHHFISNGYQCVHVATPLNLAKTFLKMATIDEHMYLQNIVMKDESESEIRRVVSELRNYDIKAILPGSESSVIITDKIANYFPVNKNESHSSLVRRHKYHMIEELNKHGLKMQKQCLAKNVDELVDWYQESGIDKIILKPPMSTASDNVYVCEDEEAIKSSYAKIYKNNNVYGYVNNEVVAQEFIEGTEYVVNSVSRAGEHFITDIWLGTTTYSDGMVEHDYADLVARNSDIHHLLTNYTQTVLDALGVSNTPAHTEIRHNANGFYLIESGSRLAGAIDPSAIMETLGYSQLSVYAESILNPTAFKARLQTDAGARHSHARYIYFSPHISGVIKRAPDFSELNRLHSLHSLYFSKDVGDEIQHASAISDIQGYAYLISHDYNQIELDYSRFKQIEKSFYEAML